MSPHVSAHLPVQVGEHHTAQAIADAHDVSSSTIRNRWYPWICKVAPDTLLKKGKSYTGLARELFAEFAKVESPQREAWVADAKSRYSQEWGTAGVIEGELMPAEVGGVLALQQTQMQSIELSVADQLANIETMIDQANAAELNISGTELRTAMVRGQQRVIALYQTELQAELQTTNSLRQRRLNRGE
ncbi:MAG: hypothetical protein AAFZ17_01465 [Cyanobacteria bacterium J06650_10]